MLVRRVLLEKQSGQEQSTLASTAAEHKWMLAASLHSLSVRRTAWRDGVCVCVCGVCLCMDLVAYKPNRVRVSRSKETPQQTTESCSVNKRENTPSDTKTNNKAQQQHNQVFLFLYVICPYLKRLFSLLLYTSPLSPCLVHPTVTGSHAGHLGPDICTHFCLLQNESDMPYQEMRLFDYCKLG
jgi:hypothetical protein